MVSISLPRRGSRVRISSSAYLSLLCLIRLESNFYRSLPFLSTSFPLTSFSLSSLLPFRVIVNINLLVLVVYRDILFILNSTSQYCLHISLLPLSAIYFHLDIPLYSLFYLKKTMLMFLGSFVCGRTNRVRYTFRSIP